MENRQGNQAPTPPPASSAGETPAAAAARAGEAGALFSIVRERYAERLTAEQLDDLRRIVASLADSARRLRAVRLRNSDEPVPPFCPFRGEP